MSISPGVTYKPDASMVLRAVEGSNLALTAAIFPSVMATSRMALMAFLASTT